MFDDLPLIPCPLCRASGSRGAQNCYACDRMAFGVYRRDKFYFWDYTIDGIEIRTRRFARVINIIVNLLLLIFTLATFAFWIFASARPDLGTTFLSLQFWQPTAGAQFWLWFGFLALWILVYRLIRLHRTQTEVDHKPFGTQTNNAPQIKEWSEIRALPRSRTIDITGSFTDAALKTIDAAYALAERHGDDEVAPVHLFISLLDAPPIQSLFIRLGIAPKTVQDGVRAFFPASPGAYTTPTSSGTGAALAQSSAKVKRQQPLPHVNELFQKTLFIAYEDAYENREPVVDLAVLFWAAYQAIPELERYFFDLGVNKQKLANVVAWVRVREQMRRQYFRRRAAAAHRPKGDTNKAMTALATPYLNRFSEDMTRLAAYGYYESMVGRDRELEEIYGVLQGGGAHVILVGERGVGKNTLIQGLAELMLEENVPKVLQDKRLVHINVAALLAGAGASEVQARLLRMLKEVREAGNIVLFIDDIERLMGVTSGSEQSLDVADVLAQELQRAGFYVLASTTPDAHRRYIVNSALGSVFQKVVIEEMDVNNTVRVLEAKAGLYEYKHKVWFMYDALEAAAELSARYLHEQFLPEKALELMREAAVAVSRQKGKDALVAREDVAVVLAQKTKIPVTAVTEDERAKLLRLEEEMHKRVIGQDEAVTLVANALRRARAEVRSGKRPIANFLFLGPTGVGKTELAKTVADVYFGSADQMIRLDMSEYQEVRSIERLLGRAGEQGTGILTEAVRQKPFALLLLDEMEKADPNILHLFLQVMDDGRLTDSTGRVIDFTNVILIATSNAATRFVEDALVVGTPLDEIKNKLIHGELKNHFRPEFLNRFDAIVLFKPLEREQIQKIAGLILAELGKNLGERGVYLEVTPAALEELAAAGFDPEFGARPLRRVIQDRVENAVAEIILKNEARRRDTIVVDAGAKVFVRSA